MARWFLAALALLTLALPAASQVPPAPSPGGAQPVYTFCQSGSTVVLCSSPGAATAATTGTPTETTVTCGTGSTTLLAASTATQFILVKVPTGGGIVWVNFAGAAAVAAPPSVDIAAGASLSWSPMQGYVPTSQINCLAPVAQAVTLVYK